jgi:CRP-like cAMP-binding protein
LDSIYFIAQGTLEIVKDDTVMAVLNKNDIFGENLRAYMENQNNIGRASCDVRALVYCDLHKIEKSNLLEILDMYPEFAQSFKNKFQVTYDLRTVNEIVKMSFLF